MFQALILMLLFFLSSNSRYCSALRRGKPSVKAPPAKCMASSAPNQEDDFFQYDSWWEEEEEQQEQSRIENPKEKIRSKFYWFGRLDDDSDSITELKQQQQQQLSMSQQEELSDPHPLRTKNWKVQVNWRGRRRRQRINKQEQERERSLEFEFSKNGYVRLIGKAKNDDDDGMIIVGHWKISPSGIIWEIPAKAIVSVLNKSCSDDSNHLNVGDKSGNGINSNTRNPKAADSSSVIYHFYADFHLNPFGVYPKMTRGLILQGKNYSNTIANNNDGTEMDNNKHVSCNKQSKASWFRPVVATFQGIGIGQDTADFSYRGRQQPQSQSQAQ